MRVHLHHGVADGRAGGEGDAVARVLLVQVARFHEEIESAFAARGLDARHPLHLGRRVEVLKHLRSRHTKMWSMPSSSNTRPSSFLSSASSARRRSSRLAFCFSRALMMLRCARLVSAAASSHSSCS